MVPELILIFKKILVPTTIMNLQGVVIFCLSIVHPFLCYEKMDMSDDSILQYLNVDPDSVIEHELVEVSFPERLHKRETYLWQDDERVTVRAFGEDINLWLHPEDGMLASPFTEVYTAHYAPEKLPTGVRFEKIPNAMDNLGRLFEANSTHLASLVIGWAENSRLTMNGFLQLRKDGIVLRSLPEDVVHRYLRKRRSTVDFNNRSSNVSYHVALKFNDDPSNENPLRNIKNMSAPTSSNEVRVKWDGITDTLYPEILVYVDSTFKDVWANNLTPFLEYLLAFWNGVDLKFRSIESPKVRLHISKIVLGVDRGATPYIMNNMFPMGKTFNRTGAIHDSAKFFYSVHNDVPMEFDVAVTMTKFWMGRNESRTYTYGTSLWISACRENHKLKRKDAVAIINGNNSFADIHTAAHEIGHILGMDHDNDGDLGNCSSENGFIMALDNSYTTVNSSSFSECSLDQLQAAIDTSNLTCLYNKPPNSMIGWEFVKLMPGRVSSLAEQCKATGHGPPCVERGYYNDICVQFLCEGKKIIWTTLCVRTRPHGAAPGTPCGNPETDPKPRFCLHNRCVSL